MQNSALLGDLARMPRHDVLSQMLTAGTPAAMATGKHEYQKNQEDCPLTDDQPRRTVTGRGAGWWYARPAEHGVMADSRSGSSVHASVKGALMKKCRFFLVSFLTLAAPVTHAEPAPRAADTKRGAIEIEAATPLEAVAMAFGLLALKMHPAKQGMCKCAELPATPDTWLDADAAVHASIGGLGVAAIQCAGSEASVPGIVGALDGFAVRVKGPLDLSARTGTDANWWGPKRSGMTVSMSSDRSTAQLSDLVAAAGKHMTLQEEELRSVVRLAWPKTAAKTASRSVPAAMPKWVASPEPTDDERKSKRWAAVASSGSLATATWAALGELAAQVPEAARQGASHNSRGGLGNGTESTSETLSEQSAVFGAVTIHGESVAKRHATGDEGAPGCQEQQSLARLVTLTATVQAAAVLTWKDWREEKTDANGPSVQRSVQITTSSPSAWSTILSEFKGQGGTIKSWRSPDGDWFARVAMPAANLRLVAEPQAK